MQTTKTNAPSYLDFNEIEAAMAVGRKERARIFASVLKALGERLFGEADQHQGDAVTSPGCVAQASR